MGNENEIERYLREQVFFYEPPYYLSFYSLEHVSKDFLREYKDIISWGYEDKKFVKRNRGEKFYRELFGEDK